MKRRLSPFSIKSLYPLALAEGEGVGTAYEYYVKRLALARWLTPLPPGGRLLLAGLPEKYGCSLDFLLLAAELGLAPVVADERPAVLAKAQAALAAAKNQGLLAGLAPAYVLAADLARLAEVGGPFSLAIASEVVQRLPAESRAIYWQRLVELAPAGALFAPNAGNPAHTNLSGLAGVELEELRELAGEQGSRGAGGQESVGYIDMPPFPPGVTRTAAQREQAGSGRLEAAVMWGLGWYARLERFFPAGVRRRQAHIVYVLRS
ncbi:MAG: hypothetical protein L0332_10500 [Chloroflexi bacterium]|nr:hypothetical protein [Chloroflexota bacterium]MCI0647885.1 hypothetical protein [Chloroflexota bacterium]MCI0727136.1 hypothetical protein [Chloroflexota bacterium]